jgi:Ca-activated chloride channel family protein
MTRDTDDLARLKAALQQAPASDPAAKMVAMDRAMEAFEKLQGAAQDSAPPPRPIQDRARLAGILRGVRHMFETLKLKPALAVTTSAAALFVGVVILLPQGGFGPGLSDRAPAPLAVDVAPLVLAEPAPAPLPAPAPAAKMAPAEARSRAQASADMEAPSVEAPANYGMAAAESAVVGAINTPQASLPDTTETFANAEANPVRITAAEPVSTFSVDVDTASYAIVRDALMAGTLPDAQAVRVEEMVNYFPYDYPAPDAGTAPFRPSVTVMPTPWNPNTRLVQIALQGRMPAVADRPPLNLVFLIDTSGSMQDADKLPLLRQSLGLMLGQLRAEDQVAIVAYAGSAGQVLPPTPAVERVTILAALDRLEAGGSTAGAEGLELAYRVAETMGGKGEVSRILLATDGDFNVGIDDPEGLEAYVARKRDTGVYLSILGFGRGNLDDAVMQSLAQNGNGTAAYIDTLQEARKVLVDQLTGALLPIANDVKIQVEWNPAAVAEYRLIGYETRALRREDFNNDAVDAGEIGAGHQVTAIYEVTAPGSPALLNDPLRYGAPEASVAPQTQGPELGFLRLRYKAPGEDVSALRETPILADTPVTVDARFAAAIAGFGQLLRGSAYLGAWDYAQAIDLASDNRGDDPFGYRIEAVNLMRLAQSLAR